MARRAVTGEHDGTAPVPATAPRSRFVQACRVEWQDTDASGRIHFTAPFRWVQAAEHALLRSLGQLSPGGYPRVDVQATYLKALRFPDEVEIRLGVQELGRTSIAWVWEVLQGDEVAVRGRYVVVHIGTGDSPRDLPSELRTKLDAMRTA